MSAKKKKAQPKKAPAKRASSKKKKPAAENPPVKAQPTYEARLTKTELVHLRDLFGIYLPPDGEMTVSGALAKAEGRVVAERLLFEKIIDLCKRAKLPVEEEAPDHIIGLAANPVLGVFPISHDEVESDEEESDEAENLQALNFLFSDDDEDQDLTDPDDEDTW